MTVAINHEAIERLVREMAKRILFAGNFVVQQHKRRVGVSYRDNGASVPGQYPRLRTAHGQAGVMMDQHTVDGVLNAGLRLRIGQAQQSWYMRHLEQNRGRLGYLKTAEDLKPMVRAIVVGA